MSVLITGGAGLIGSTVANYILDRGIDVVLVDSLENGRLEFMSDKKHYICDISDEGSMRSIFLENPDIKHVIHFAALISVDESMRIPGKYYEFNTQKSLSFLNICIENKIEQFIYSSTAAVYGNNSTNFMVTEKTAVDPLSPYGRSKLYFENILRDITQISSIRSIVFRYFNVIGADPKLRTGFYKESPSHLLGKLLEVDRLGGRLTIYGTDYPTRDGTGLRDYIDIWDLAEAHYKALVSDISEKWSLINLGAGRGYTVMEVIRSFESLTGRRLEVSFSDRRAGDVVGAYTDNSLGRELLHWLPKVELEESIAKALAWQDKLDKLKLE